MNEQNDLLGESLDSRKYLIAEGMQEEGTEKKFIHTHIVFDGKIVTARINSDTGEIKPYRKPKKGHTQAEIIAMIRAKPDAADMMPFWVQMPIACKTVTEGLPKMTNSTKLMLNNHCSVLSSVKTYAELVEDVPEADNIFSGAVYLHAGDKPYSKGKMLVILKNEWSLSTATLMSKYGYQKKSAEKVFSVLRVILNGLNKISWLMSEHIGAFRERDEAELWEIMQNYQRSHPCTDETLAYEFAEELPFLNTLRARYSSKQLAQEQLLELELA